MNKLISLIITTYNWPVALDRVLESLHSQSDSNFEVIIADDGSDSPTTDLIQKHVAKAPFPISHYWQEDHGYRAAAVRNGAVRMSKGEYIIFIDGDCIILPDFIAKHRKLAEPDWFVSGRRCYLKKPFSALILNYLLPIHRIPRPVLFVIGLSLNFNRPFQLVPFPYTDAKQKNNATNFKKAQTCNLAVWRDDFIKVDGLDEIYTEFGNEDSDFVIRLIRNNVYKKRAEFSSPVMHLYHKRRKLTKTKRGRSIHLINLINDTKRKSPIKGYKKK